MIDWRTLALSLVVLLAMGCAGGGEEEASESAAGQPPPLPPDIGNPTPRVVLETTKGRIVLELDRDKAPQTVENILFHVQNRFYDGLTFHRVRPDFMIQAGGFTPELAQRQSPRPSIRNEANNGLKNVRGSVAMARTPEPHSASTGFFINLVDNPQLDFTAETPSGWGYAVFGKVVEGLDVVDAIATVATEQRGPHEAVPLEPIVIERAFVESG